MELSAWNVSPCLCEIRHVDGSPSPRKVGRGGGHLSLERVPTAQIVMERRNINSKV